MRFLRKVAFAAGALCAPSLAMAQYNYGAPATLPVPTQQVRPLAYYSAPASPTAAAYPDETVPAPTPAPAAQGYGPNTNYYDSALSNEQGQGNCSTCNGGDGGCADGNCGWGGWNAGDACCCGPSWYASVAALYMERNRPNPFQISFDTTNPVGQLILNTDTFSDWQPGIDVRVGKYLCCNSAIEFGYWTLDNFGGTVYASDPVGVGSLNTPFDFRSLNFNGVPVNALFDGAQTHRFTRNDELHNLELNFVHWPTLCDPCSRLQVSGLVGLRYFQFREGWELATSFNDPNFGVDPTGEAYWNINVQNRMLGLQLGGRACYNFSCKLSAYASPRFGAFWNHMEQTTCIYTGDPISALAECSDKDAISLMGQLDVGLNYQITPCIGIWGGYRVVAFSGIALSDAQIPFLADDLVGIRDIDHNSNLVLHGLMGGVTVNF